MSFQCLTPLLLNRKQLHVSLHKLGPLRKTRQECHRSSKAGGLSQRNWKNATLKGSCCSRWKMFKPQEESHSVMVMPSFFLQMRNLPLELQEQCQSALAISLKDHICSWWSDFQSSLQSSRTFSMVQIRLVEEQESFLRRQWYFLTLYHNWEEFLYVKFAATRYCCIP